MGEPPPIAWRRVGWVAEGMDGGQPGTHTAGSSCRLNRGQMLLTLGLTSMGQAQREHGERPGEETKAGYEQGEQGGICA